MKIIILALLLIINFHLSHAQRVGIGTTTPVAKLDIRGVAADPAIPASTSTGILRIGVSANEGIDIGKMGTTPFTGWIQSGFNGNPEPLSFQPLGGNVGIGTTNPVTKMNVSGTAGGPSIPGTSSSGVLRIGVSAFEAIDIGKMLVAPYAGWIQSGYNGTAEPLCLQPLGSSVSIGTTSAATSAVLDVSSTTKGFLPPRMTLTDRNNIASPVEGLMIWCNNCGFYGQVQVYNGGFWADMAGEPAIGVITVGVHDGGGIVAYILQVGDPGYIAGEVHGLIAAPTDLAVETQWGCQTFAIPGADAVAIGSGNQNTTDILNGCTYPGIAARFCGNLNIGGYTDWYLPSKNELNRLYNNKDIIGGFWGDYYWSSTENSNDLAWSQSLYFGAQVQIEKQYKLAVRAIRSF